MATLATSQTFAAAAPRERRLADGEAGLRAACDRLVDSAIRSPFGWGWVGVDADPGADADGESRESPLKRESIDLKATAAVGLLLHIAGSSLNDERYADAAVNAARSLSAAQGPTGQMPRRARLMPRPAGRDEPALVPSRDATCAALGLLLVLCDDAGAGIREGHAASGDADDIAARLPAPYDRFERSATRAAAWLAAQQTASGAWPVAYPPDADRKTAQRLIRLDEPGYRDATLALLMSAEVLGKRRFADAADSALNELLRMRIRVWGARGRGLWASAYWPNGAPNQDLAELPFAVDTLASRRAMQTLLGAWLLIGADRLPSALTGAVRALDELPPHDSQWRRRYDLFPQRPTTRPAEVEEGLPPMFPEAEERDVEHVELSDVLGAIDRAKASGADRCRDDLVQVLGVPQRVPLLLCGIDDGALTFESPDDVSTEPDAGTSDVQRAWQRLAMFLVE